MNTIDTYILKQTNNKAHFKLLLQTYYQYIYIYILVYLDRFGVYFFEQI